MYAVSEQFPSVVIVFFWHLHSQLAGHHAGRKIFGTHRVIVLATRGEDGRESNNKDYNQRSRGNVKIPLYLLKAYMPYIYTNRGAKAQICGRTLIGIRRCKDRKNEEKGENVRGASG